MTFSSPSWRSLNPLKGSLNHPKRVTKNCQEPNLFAEIHSTLIFFNRPSRSCTYRTSIPLSQYSTLQPAQRIQLREAVLATCAVLDHASPLATRKHMADSSAGSSCARQPIPNRSLVSVVAPSCIVGYVPSKNATFLG